MVKSVHFFAAVLFHRQHFPDRRCKLIFRPITESGAGGMGSGRGSMGGGRGGMGGEKPFGTEKAGGAGMPREPGQQRPMPGAAA